MARYLVFVGVTTAQSSIVPIFPGWRDLLGLGADVELTGCDLPLHAPPERYREAVQTIKDDPQRLGGLVTTHKIDLFRAARDLFDDLDDYARLLGDVSAIAKRGGRLVGAATDPISAGRTLDNMLGSGYFGRTGGHVLCFGSGGAGHAINLHLLTRSETGDRPGRLIVTDRNADRLESLRALHGRLALPENHAAAVEYVENADPALNDCLVTQLPPHSLIVNATGMGKDTPGSPITGAARFPPDAVAWELNYRGELDFVRQALAQQESRGVRVEDGWEYFIRGWAAVIEHVFNRPISEEELQTLARAADFARPSREA